MNLVINRSFAKVFACNIQVRLPDESIVTIQRQGLFRQVGADQSGNVVFVFETTTLDGAQVYTHATTKPEDAEAFFDDFGEDKASQLIQIYAVQTLDQINSNQDIDLEPTGVTFNA